MRLTDLVKDGKIYLSLSDAIALAIENNYDIAIARYDLDIADTDILRTKTGAAPLGVPTAIVTRHTHRIFFDCFHRRRCPGGTQLARVVQDPECNGLTLPLPAPAPRRRPSILHHRNHSV